jgi:hypothetical protein
MPYANDGPQRNADRTPPHIAQTDPSFRGGHYLVKVAADARFGRGRQVTSREPDRTGLTRHRPQQDLLDDLGDQPDPCQFVVPAPAGPAGQRTGRRDAGHDQERNSGHAVSGAGLRTDREHQANRQGHSTGSISLAPEWIAGSG